MNRLSGDLEGLVQCSSPWCSEGELHVQLDLECERLCRSMPEMSSWSLSIFPTQSCVSRSAASSCSKASVTVSRSKPAATDVA